MAAARPAAYNPLRNFRNFERAPAAREGPRRRDVGAGQGRGGSMVDRARRGERPGEAWSDSALDASVATTSPRDESTRDRNATSGDQEHVAPAIALDGSPV